MKKRRIILGVIAVAVIGGAWFGYRAYNRKVKDLANVKAQITMHSSELIAAFEKNETVANTELLDKIIAVKGRVKEIEKNDRGHYTIVLGDTARMSSVRCSMDSVHVKEITGLSEGSDVTVKGACTGFNADELLGSDVVLNRCVIEENN
jgi:hypothetical protein